MKRNSQLTTLPNSLTIIRLVLIPALWLCAFQGHATWIGIGLVLALLTDMLDGMAARWLRQVTPLGAFLDSLADKLLTLSVIGWLALLFPEIFTDQPHLIALTIAGFASSWLIGWLGFGSMPRLRLVSAWWRHASSIHTAYILNGPVQPGAALPGAWRRPAWQRWKRLLSNSSLLCRMNTFARCSNHRSGQRSQT